MTDKAKGCSFPECQKPHEARGYCKGHYEQIRSGRELAALTGWTHTSRMSFEERFWFYVNKTSACWEWTGATRSDGYGVIHREGRLMAAHRISYEMVFGPVEAGKVVDHKCRNRRCVNPSHLHQVTRKQNGENLSSKALRGNRSGVRGVSWDRNTDKWRGRVKHHGVEYRVGLFDSVADAEAAVVAKRNELYTNNLADRRAG